MASAININAATVQQLTQLPGIAKNLAYRIVNHRDRHGYFTAWEELAEVKGFPTRALEEIKKRANLLPPEGVRPEEFGPRRAKPAHLDKVAKKPRLHQSNSRNAYFRPSEACQLTGFPNNAHRKPI